MELSRQNPTEIYRKAIMEWISFHVKTLDSIEYLSATEKNRSAWMSLMRYCAGQENGGRIKSCREWSARVWEQIVRVQRRVVLSASTLWSWDDEDLVVKYYPSEREAQLQSARANGSKGGYVKASRTASSTPTRVATSTPTGNPSAYSRVMKSNVGESSVGGCGGGDSLSVPSLEEFLSWTRSHPGIPAAGFSGPIPEEWAQSFYNYFAVDHPEKWPAGDWRDFAQRRFLDNWRLGAFGARKKNAHTINELEKAARCLEEKIKAHPAFDDPNGEAAEDEVEDLDKLQEQLRAIKEKIIKAAE